MSIDEILTLARWGDVLAAREVRSSRTGAYTATMDPVRAEWLAGLAEPTGGHSPRRRTSPAHRRRRRAFPGSPESQPYVDTNDMVPLDPMDSPIQLIGER
ncbi:hypothetical protein G3I59_17510 [Amycolatopsis rubida]|uniref:Uncharacterized protein n=1 Tax=Amycolatopsis rubida TaxID=112413 RepID=A0ABX0BX31_9PSEU|nr:MULTISPECIES: hypothetical protein [Amycolatopsis]MYW92353.1 hypothetical protein [Amycolatopsis rubida]NEC57341.1 hypothetical protein [Amycolatopsis rubida]